jgi:hypothetical protein
MYSPRAAWRRALLWFAFCAAVSWSTGVLPRLLEGPVPSAWAHSAGARVLCLAIIAQWAFAYLYLWPRGTVTLGRPRRVLLGVLFGALWGSAQSLLWLSVLALVQRFPHWRDAPTPQHRAEGLPEAELTGMPRARVLTR